MNSSDQEDYQPEKTKKKGRPKKQKKEQSQEIKVEKPKANRREKKKKQDQTFTFQQKPQPMAPQFMKAVKASGPEVREFSLQGLVKICKVVQIYDGDTLKVVTEVNGVLMKMPLRLQGFDTAQMKSKVPEIKEFAQMTKNILVKLALNKLVKVKFGKSEKYGRTLASIMVLCLGGQFCLNDWMIDNNLGLRYDGGHKQEYTSQLVSKLKEQISKLQLPQTRDYD